DLAKVAVNRLAFSQGHELQPHGGTAVSITPGWLRSEMMLENFGVSEDRWRDALAAAPDRQRWNQRSVTSGRLAVTYGFTDIDGSRPDVWKYMEDVEAGRDADPENYR